MYSFFWKPRLENFFSTYGFALFSISFFFSLYLGILGFVFQNGLEQFSIFDNIYFGTQLIVLESGQISYPVNYLLQISRFAVPLIAGVMTIYAIFSIFTDQVENFKRNLLKNHIIIYGLNNRSISFAEKSKAIGHPVLFINKDETTNLSHRCKTIGVFLVNGTLDNPKILKLAKIETAAYFVSINENDEDNLNAFNQIQKYKKTQRLKLISCLMHVSDPIISAKIKAYSTNEEIKPVIININKEGIEELIKRYPPIANECTRKNKLIPIHDKEGSKIHGILIFGHGLLIKSFLEYIINIYGTYRFNITTEKIQIIFFGEDKEETINYIKTIPNFERVIILDQIRFFAENEDVLMILGTEIAKYKIAYIFMDDDTLSIKKGLNLHSTLKNKFIDVVVCVQDCSGLSSLTSQFKNELQDKCNYFHILSFSDVIFDPKRLPKSIHNSVAAKANEHYIKIFNASQKIPPYLQDSTLDEIISYKQHLKKKGYEVKPIQSFKAIKFSFDDDLTIKNELAALEHMRWYRERLGMGYVYGEETDRDKRINKNLRCWNEVSDETYKYNLTCVENWPKQLLELGDEIVPPSRNQ